METLDRMFPDGYLIVYTCPDGQIRFGSWNPRHIEVIDMWKNAMMKSSEENPPSFWEPEGWNG